MIDWKRRCLELADVVKRYRTYSFNSDIKIAEKMAQELIELGKREDKARQKFMEYWRCADKKESAQLYAEYLELIR